MVVRMALDTRTWIDHYAAAVGAETLSETEVDVLLELAGAAAHAAERTAAPLSCWLAGKAGIAPSEALTLAQALIASLQDAN